MHDQVSGQTHETVGCFNYWLREPHVQTQAIPGGSNNYIYQYYNNYQLISYNNFISQKVVIVPCIIS